MSNFLNGLQRLWQNKMMRTFMLAIILIILIIIIVVASIGSKPKTINESNLINATKKYVSSNSNLLPTNEYDSRVVNLSTLISNGYLKSDSTCSSYVTIVKIGNEYIYTPYINCGNDSDTVLLRNKLLSDIVTEGVGLYNNNNEYIYRGESPNNHITLGGKKWRIIGIDSNNNIKLLYNDIYLDYEPWDDRYNSVDDSQSGINDYNLSRAKEYLDSYINNDIETFTKEIKAKLARHSACIGKIDINSSVINTCSNVLDNQLASLITVNNYIDASLDSLCNISNIKNCQNYNYLNNNGWTINASTKDNMTVYYIDTEYTIQESKAYMPKAIRPVIALKNDVIYVSGDGTVTNPYTIK